jgi:hypothetical protein
MIQPAAYRVLHCFLYNDTQFFVQLCKSANYPTDLGGYYIRQLMEGGYVTKTDRGQYTITARGKQQIVVAKDKQPFTMRPRLMVLLVPVQDGKYLTLERNRQPFLKTAEWPAGAVNLGEKLPDAAKRILKSRLHVEGTPTLRGFFRRTDFYLDKDTVFDDKLFAVHSIELEPTQHAAPEDPDKLVVCTDDDLIGLPRRAKSLVDIYTFIQNDIATYEERSYILQQNDLAL